ncbi:MAG: hypothetical protein JWO38_2342 [Gemmataceae bacterium]|nr:hypothetical protein [Gemmataceae bacterium]
MTAAPKQPLVERVARNLAAAEGIRWIELNYLQIEQFEKRAKADIECCRETYFNAAGEIFAVVGDILVDTAYSKPHRIELLADAKLRLFPPA